MDAIGGCDFDAVLDHLVLHTPEHLLPNAFKEKKQPEPQPVVEAHRQQRQQPGSSSKVSAFLPQPIILKPGQKVWKADPSEVLQPPKLQGAASGGVVGVVKPLTGAEEKKVVNLVAFGFDRLQCIDALKKTVGDAQKALVHLLASLYPHADEGPAAGGFDIDEDEVEDMRFDERTAVESMYGEDAFKEVWFQIGHIVGCEVKLEVRGIKGPVRLLCRYDLPCQYPYRPPYLLVRSDGNGSISDSQALKSSHELCAHAAKLVKANPGVPVVFDLCTWLKERMEDDIREQRANSQKPQSSPPKPKQERPKKDQDHQVKKTPLAAVEAFCDKKLNNDHYQKMAANTQAKLSKAETLEKQLAEVSGLGFYGLGEAAGRGEWCSSNLAFEIHKCCFQIALSTAHVSPCAAFGLRVEGSGEQPGMLFSSIIPRLRCFSTGRSDGRFSYSCKHTIHGMLRSLLCQVMDRKP